MATTGLLYISTITLKVFPPFTDQVAQSNVVLEVWLISDCRSQSILIYSALRASSFLFIMSSRALVLLGPHLALNASSLLRSYSFLSFDASQHIFTKNIEQLNFLANLAAVHLNGSWVRKCRISAMSDSLRWCLTPIGLNLEMTGGSRVEGDFAVVAAKSCFRLSSFGRNMEGVWFIDGADDGGLKTMWSSRGDLFERRKDESGLTFRSFFDRRYEDSCRRDAEMREKRHWILPEKRPMIGRCSNLASIVEERRGAWDWMIARSFWRLRFSNFGETR